MEWITVESTERVQFIRFQPISRKRESKREKEKRTHGNIDCRTWKTTSSTVSVRIAINSWLKTRFSSLRQLSQCCLLSRIWIRREHTSVLCSLVPNNAKHATQNCYRHNHKTRTIDLFSLDCSSCEFVSASIWLRATQLVVSHSLSALVVSVLQWIEKIYGRGCSWELFRKTFELIDIGHGHGHTIETEA